MSTAPAALGSALRVRIMVDAADHEAAARLARLVAAAGHDPVGAHMPADVVVTDGSAALATGAGVVALGVGDGDFAGLLPGYAEPAQLDAALRAVAAGLSVRPYKAPLPGFAALPEAPPTPLTPREIEVLAALADGLANKAVARRLGISPHTVKFHIEQLFRKLGVSTRAEAVANGLRRQIVEL